MGGENESGFWIPPEEKQDQPGIPLQIPIPENTPPPDFNPDDEKEKPEMDDHPKEEDDNEPIHHDVPFTNNEQESPRGTVIIGPDGQEDNDSGIFEDKIKEW